MPNIQTDNRPIPEIKQLDEFQEKFLRLPGYAQDWMCSIKAAENNAEIAAKFRLSEDKNPVIAKITGDVILKDFTLDALPSFLQENLKIDSQTARQLTLEIAAKQLLIVRDHLKGIENFILKLGGTLPKNLPDASATLATSPAPSAPQFPEVIKKPFRLAVQENKEILNQLLTASPIKIADFEQPVRPTIKNWLSDYIKQKGTGYHDELERSDYLYKNANAANLPNKERAKLAKILRAYDEDAEVPISSENKLILIEELSKKESPKQPTIPTAPPVQTALPVQPPPTRSEPTAKAGPDTYREPVAEEDLTGPFKPLVKPIPRLDGNVVDLKEFGNNKE